ncbi:hypothetical protein HOU02_gp304 [Caulobacter phage CcrBL9]|uniref:Uncharacterized protein n=1 Tax=Caulobacter phage CcrBL9 TaxID=2283270 RepID=A0A385EC09_9CAUD|nr:hypothetical protein HOU02_gp304 [Caulobacter phage CcrBL9]AXQ69421.1 hypothetical protein CcrBL9_gp397 [Caulobacter phage CcrBL9]
MGEPYRPPLSDANLALIVKALERYTMDERAVAFNDRMSMDIRAAAKTKADEASKLRLDLLNRTIS